MAGNSGRLPSLDGWRAVAILIVLLSHWWAAGGRGIPLWVNSLIAFGDTGVRIFLVISGFLITLLLLRESATHGRISLRNFYIRRTFRIFPVYFSYLLVLLLLSWAGLYHDALSTWLGSLTFTRNVVGQGDSATGHLWSLAVEEQFYIGWPLLLAGLGLATRPKPAVAFLLALVVVAVLTRTSTCVDRSFLCERVLGQKSLLRYADSLALGCIAAFVYARRFDLVPASSRAFYGALALFGFSTAVGHAAPSMSGVIVAVQSASIALCILVSVKGRPKYAFGVLNHPWAVKLGVLSYSLYVWHMLFLPVYIGERFRDVLFMDWRIWFVSAIILSFASYYLLERPLIRFRDRFIKEPEASPPPTSDSHGVGADAPGILDLPVGLDRPVWKKSAVS